MISASIPIKILFFGATAEAVGLREAVLETEPLVTVEIVLQRLLDRYPQLSQHKLLTAINEEYALPGGVLKDGDQLAIFTAVSGG